HPGDRVPHDRTSPLPDDPDPPSLRERRLEGDHGDHPVLAPRGHLLRPGHRAVLRRLARAFGGVTGMTQHQHQHVQGPEIRDLAGVRALVLGAGVSGPGAVRILHALGAQPVVADSRPEALERLRTALPPDVDCEGVDLDRAAELVSAPAERGGVGLVVTSPGWRPDAPLLRAAADSGVAVWGDIELAWRADRAELFGPARTWLAVTGTNGKTTTTSRLEAICLEAGMAARACGNIGLPVTDVLLAEPRVEVLAAELSSFQLHWAPSCRPEVGVVLNVAEDHLTGTARWSPTPRPRPGSSPGGWPSPAPTTRSPRDCWPAPRRAPASRSASPRPPRGGSASSTASSPPGPTTTRCRCSPRTRCVRPAPPGCWMRSRPPLWRCPSAPAPSTWAPRCRASRWGRTAPSTSTRSTASATWTTPRRPTRTRPAPRSWPGVRPSG